MKYNIIIYLLFAIVIHENASAQVKVRSYGGKLLELITINGTTAGVTDLSILDTLDKGNSLQDKDRISSDPILHLANFKIYLDNDGLGVLKSLFNLGQKGAPVSSLIISRISGTDLIVEKRVFSGVTIKEISLSQLNPEAKIEIPTAEVTIRADQVINDFNRRGSTPGTSKPRAVGSTGSMFMLNMDNIPTQSVSRVGSIKIFSSSNAGYIYFDIDIPLTEITQWMNWLNNRPGGEIERRNAIISLRDRSMHDIGSIQLPQVEIISISSPQSSPDRIPGITIGLRTNQSVVIN